MDERDLRDGQLYVTQSKTGAKRRIEIIGELAAVLDRIKARKAGHKVRSTKLVATDEGANDRIDVRSRFDDARKSAGIAKADFQPRDLRAKAGTVKAELSGDITQARDQLGHTTVVMANRKGGKGIADAIIAEQTGLPLVFASH